MGNYNFRKDLKRAKDSEEEDARLLEDSYDITLLEQGNNDNKWDFAILWNGKRFTVEHKEDMMAKVTGNIAVEFQCRGSPSGISVSQADYYYYRVHTKNGIQRYIINVSSLKELIEKKLYHRIVSGGDRGSNTKMYLFKLDIFEKYAKELHSEEDEKYKNISVKKMKTIIAISGRRELSKRFVKDAVSLGYDVEKINPARASKEVSEIIIPRDKEYQDEEEKFYLSTQEFLDKHNGYYWYTLQKIKSFLGPKGRQLALLVNTPHEILEALKDDVEAFCIHLGNSNPPRGMDFIIDDDEEFSQKVSKILSVLSRDIDKMKKFKE